jgi:hypothetical protein
MIDAILKKANVRAEIKNNIMPILDEVMSDTENKTLALRAARHYTYIGLRDALRGVVAPLMPFPSPCSIYELLELGTEHLAFGGWEDFDRCYDRFVLSVASAIATPILTEPFELCELHGGSDLTEVDCCLWEQQSLRLICAGRVHQSGIRDEHARRYLGVLPQTDEINPSEFDLGDELSTCVLLARVQGSFTPIALSDAREQVQAVAEVMRQVWDITTRFSERFSDRTANVGERDERRVKLLRELLDAYFEPNPGKKRNLQRRLQNAVRLFVEANRQASPMIRLGLTFSGVEALICDNNEGIGDQLSRRISILLCFDKNDRLEMIKQIKRLYGLRSEILHGDDKGSLTAVHARHVTEMAMYVLRAFLEWRRFNERMSGTAPKEEAFFLELREADITARSVVGVPEMTHKLIWEA